MTPVKTVEKPMTMKQIKEKALYLNINPGTMNKTELIHAIQAAEGNQQCYGTSNGTCQWTNCCFRADCLKIRN